MSDVFGEDFLQDIVSVQWSTGLQIDYDLTYGGATASPAKLIMPDGTSNDITKPFGSSSKNTSWDQPPPPTSQTTTKTIIVTQWVIDTAYWIIYHKASIAGYWKAGRVAAAAFYTEGVTGPAAAAQVGAGYYNYMINNGIGVIPGDGPPNYSNYSAVYIRDAALSDVENLTSFSPENIALFTYPPDPGFFTVDTGGDPPQIFIQTAHPTQVPETTTTTEVKGKAFVNIGRIMASYPKGKAPKQLVFKLQLQSQPQYTITAQTQYSLAASAKAASSYTVTSGGTEGALPTITLTVTVNGLGLTGSVG